MIRSPATMTVEFSSNTYSEENGIIYIANTQSGNYNLKIQGTAQ
ncbi:MAG: hypothetical protein NT162_00670 [Candidatus Woesebacteria bacterium]|nr:hypothetical protein [Candidatus Woesebacteria bacterium]